MILLFDIVFQSGEFISESGGNNLLSNLIPIVVVFLAGFLALIQVKANVISAARIRWNEELRKSISEYLMNLSYITFQIGDFNKYKRSKNATQKEIEYRMNTLLQDNSIKKVV